MQTPHPYPDHSLSGLPAALLRPARAAFWMGVLGGMALLVVALLGGGPSAAALTAMARVFPGYGASPLGSAAGIGYGFAAGAAGGWLLAVAYNRLAT